MQGYYGYGPHPLAGTGDAQESKRGNDPMVGMHIVQIDRCCIENNAFICEYTIVKSNNPQQMPSMKARWYRSFVGKPAVVEMAKRQIKSFVKAVAGFRHGDDQGKAFDRNVDAVIFAAVGPQNMLAGLRVMVNANMGKPFQKDGATKQYVEQSFEPDPESAPQVGRIIEALSRAPAPQMGAPAPQGGQPGFGQAPSPGYGQPGGFAPQGFQPPQQGLAPPGYGGPPGQAPGAPQGMQPATSPFPQGAWAQPPQGGLQPPAGPPMGGQGFGPPPGAFVPPQAPQGGLAPQGNGFGQAPPPQAPQNGQTYPGPFGGQVPVPLGYAHTPQGFVKQG